MPIHEYLCGFCAHKFELFQKANDPIKRKCPQCKKMKLVQFLGAPAFRIQGQRMNHTSRKRAK